MADQAVAAGERGSGDRGGGSEDSAGESSGLPTRVVGGRSGRGGSRGAEEADGLRNWYVMIGVIFL